MLMTAGRWPELLASSQEAFRRERKPGFVTDAYSTHAVLAAVMVGDEAVARQQPFQAAPLYATTFHSSAFLGALLRIPEAKRKRVLSILPKVIAERWKQSIKERPSFFKK